MRYSFISILFFVSFITVAQSEYIVRDKITNEPLPNTLIFYQENSIYTDKNGVFSLPNDLENQIIAVDCLGYKLLKINTSSIKEHTIFLSRKIEFLSEIELKGTPKKRRKITEKPSKKKYWLDGTPHYHGREYGLFIPKLNQTKDFKLKSITIPIIKKNADWEKAENYREKYPNKNETPIKTKKLQSSFLYRIQFYEVAADSSFVKLDYPITTLVISSDNFKYRIDYTGDDILFPEKGLLIGVLNMGPCDDKGNLLSIPRFKKLKFKGKEIKAMNNKWDVPLIALHPKTKNEAIGFINFHMTQDSKWSLIPKKHFPRVLGGPLKQLGIGYELEELTY